MNDSLGGISHDPTLPTPAPTGASTRPQVSIPSSGKKAELPQGFTQAAVKAAKEGGTPLADVARVAYVATDDLKNKLKPGDVFLTYEPKTIDTVGLGISAIQRAVKNVLVRGIDESHNFVHAALYVGDGKLSESVAQGLRINEFTGDRFTLKEGMSHGFLVIRPKNERLGQEAARIAKELSTEAASESSIHEYSIMKALGATVSDGYLREDGVKRYLKGAAYAINGIQPTDANGIRAFFCSYFVGWVFQAGESKDVIDKVNAALPAGNKIEIPHIDSSLSAEEQGRILEKWATDTARKHYGLLKDTIELKFDPKLTTPQHLYMFFLEHPELFTQEMLIVAPASPELQASANSVNSAALSSLHLEDLAQGKDKKVFVVSKDDLVQMAGADRKKWENQVFIAPIKANRNRLVKEEYDLMDQIRLALDKHPDEETNLALAFKRVKMADGKEYYVMEKGISNAEKAIRDPSLPFEMRLSYCSQVINGLLNLHNTERVHGDLKPENLLLFPGHLLRIADFGRSKVVDGNNPAGRYEGNTRFGPPEGELSKAGDVYGAGLVMMRILEEAVLKGEGSLIDVDKKIKKSPAAHDSRQGVERYILEEPAFMRSFETKETGWGGKLKDGAARAATIGGLIGKKTLKTEEAALNRYIAKLCEALVKNSSLTKSQAADLELLLRDMTQIDQTQRPTMDQVAERFGTVLQQLFSATDSDTSESVFTETSSSVLESLESMATDSVVLRGVKMTPLGKGKVNVVNTVTYQEQGVEKTAAFKPNQPEETSIIERFWGTAMGSGIPPGKEARLPERAVASSIVDRLLFPDNPVSVNTRFAVVNGQEGILMEMAKGASPKVIDQHERLVTPEEWEKVGQVLAMLGVKDTLSPENLSFCARLLGVDRVEVKIVEDVKTLVAITKKYENFTPENETTAQGLLKLQVLDWICGQVDRHQGNYFVDKEGNVTGIDQDCSFGVNAVPKGDVRRQPTLGVIVPNMGSLMLRMPAVVTESVARDIMQLWENRDAILASLAQLITRDELKATMARLGMLVNHIQDQEACMVVRDGVLCSIAKDETVLPEAERLINSDNSYWAREVNKFRKGETNLNNLRA